MSSEYVGGLSRRSVILGAVATAVVVTADDCSEAAEDPLEAVERNARLVADCMKAIHGGSWNVNVSHSLGMVSISKQVT